MAPATDTQMVCGLHPVRLALEHRGAACQKLVVEAGPPNSRVQAVLELARKQGVRIDTLPREVFRKKYREMHHQRLVAYFAPRAPLDLDALLDQAARQTDPPVLALLDGIQDPQNLGAILRSAEALGLAGAVVPRHRSAPLNETTARCAAGGLEFLAIAQTGNLVQAVRTLKKQGYWVVGLDAAGPDPIQEFSFAYPLALVLGGEARGIRPLLKKQCDALVRIPMAGRVESLNASAAAAVAFYEALRQRRPAGTASHKKSGR